MRPKFLFATAFGFLIFIVAGFFFKKEQPSLEKQIAGRVENVSTVNPTQRQVNSPQLISPPSLTNSPEKSPARLTNSPAEKIATLEELSARNDQESFRQIISQLRDANPVIRKAALEATIQFGNREAIPILKDLAAATEDAHEKVEILDAAKFLEMPSLSEIRAQRRTNSTATPIRR